MVNKGKEENSCKVIDLKTNTALNIFYEVGVEFRLLF
jgi:hypothetical protein